MARTPTDDEVEEARLRGLVAREIGEAQRAIGALRIFFASNAVVSAIVFALALLALSAGEGDLPGPALAGVVLLGVQTVAMAAGAFLLPRHPFPWAAGMASLVTLGVLSLFAGGRLGIGMFLGPVWAAALWVAAFKARGLAPLLREHADTYTARRARGETAPAPGGEATARVRLRERRSRKGARKGLGGFLWIAATVVVVGGLAAFVLLRPPPLEPSLDRFEEAWDAGDAAALGSLFRDPREGRRADGIGAFLEKRGWTPRPPAVAERRLERRGERSAAVLFLLDGGKGNVETVWMLEGGRWVLAKLQPPPR